MLQQDKGWISSGAGAVGRKETQKIKEIPMTKNSKAQALTNFLRSIF